MKKKKKKAAKYPRLGEALVKFAQEVRHGAWVISGAVITSFFVNVDVGLVVATMIVWLMLQALALVIHASARKEK